MNDPLHFIHQNHSNPQDYFKFFKHFRKLCFKNALFGLQWSHFTGFFIDCNKIEKREEKEEENVKVKKHNLLNVMTKVWILNLYVYE